MMSAPAPIKILITGFGPFPGVRWNPSGGLLDWIEERRSLMSGDIKLRTVLVPTSWKAAERFVATDLRAFDPDIALHFGVHRRAGGFRIEKFARNRASTQPDVEGMRLRQNGLVASAPRTLRATVDTERLVHALAARGFEAALSSSAGRYLCNMLFYLSLDESRRNGRARRTGFIHIPPLSRPDTPVQEDGARPFNKNTLLGGIDVIVGQCVGAHRRAMHARTDHR